MNFFKHISNGNLIWRTWSIFIKNAYTATFALNCLMIYGQWRRCKAARSFDEHPFNLIVCFLFQKGIFYRGSIFNFPCCNKITKFDLFKWLSFAIKPCSNLRVCHYFCEGLCLPKILLLKYHQPILWTMPDVCHAGLIYLYLKSLFPIIYKILSFKLFFQQ